MKTHKSNSSTPEYVDLNFTCVVYLDLVHPFNFSQLLILCEGYMSIHTREDYLFLVRRSKFGCKIDT